MIQYQHDASGVNLYAILRNASGQVFNTAGAAFEAYNAANWADYDVPLIEQGATRYYTAAMPAAVNTAMTLAVTVHEQAGGAPAVTDEVLTGGILEWTGTTWATAGSVTALADNVISESKIAAGALTAAKFAAGAFDAVWTVANRTLTAFGFNVNVGSFTAGVIDSAALGASAAEEIAAAVETAILNEGDLRPVLEAIRLKIEESDDDLTTALIATAVRAEMEANGTSLEQILTRVLKALPDAEPNAAPSGPGADGGLLMMNDLGLVQVDLWAIKGSLLGEEAGGGGIMAGAFSNFFNAESELNVEPIDHIHADINSILAHAALTRKIEEADVFTDKTASPWKMIFIEKGTGAPGVGTEIMRKVLRDVDGNAVDATTDIPGQWVHTASP